MHDFQIRRHFVKKCLYLGKQFAHSLVNATHKITVTCQNFFFTPRRLLDALEFLSLIGSLKFLFAQPKEGFIFGFLQFGQSPVHLSFPCLMAFLLCPSLFCKPRQLSLSLFFKPGFFLLEFIRPFNGLLGLTLLLLSAFVFVLLRSQKQTCQRVPYYLMVD